MYKILITLLVVGLFTACECDTHDKKASSIASSADKRRVEEKAKAKEVCDSNQHAIIKYDRYAGQYIIYEVICIPKELENANIRLE